MCITRREVVGRGNRRNKTFLNFGSICNSQSILLCCAVKDKAVILSSRIYIFDRLLGHLVWLCAAI